MKDVQPSLDKSIHLFWSGDENPKSVLPGAKHLDPLLQTAQRHQPAPPNKGFLGMWSFLGARHGDFGQLVTTLARLLGMPMARGVWMGLTPVLEASLVWSSILSYPQCVQQI